MRFPTFYDHTIIQGTQLLGIVVGSRFSLCNEADKDLSSPYIARETLPSGVTPTRHHLRRPAHDLPCMTEDKVARLETRGP
jgi:hypothetical protein